MMNRIRHNSLHRSIAYELSIYCSSLIYFSVAIAIIITKYQNHYFCYYYLFLPLPLLSYYFATKYFATDTKFPGVVELTTQLLILENILWLPLCQINKFGLNTLPSKIVVIPYVGHHALNTESVKNRIVCSNLYSNHTYTTPQILKK